MLTLKESKIMTVRSGIESSLVRVPEKLRNELGLQLGEFIVIKDVALQVEQAYGVDLEHDPTVAYVTDNNLTLLGGGINKIEIVRNVTLGCDPEFFLFDRTRNNLYAPSVLFKKTGPVGWDGMMTELRPAPSIEPQVVTNNLFKLLNQAKAVLNEKKLEYVHMIAKSSAYNHFAGFHIHLGIPVNLLDSRSINYTKIIHILVKSLDYFVGIPAMLAEGEDYDRRCNPFVNYGKVGDFRVNTRTLEYRVPGGALLRHPDLTKGLLSLSSLVVHDTIEKMRLLTNNFATRIIHNEDLILKKMFPSAKNSRELFGIICSPSIAKAEAEKETVVRLLKDMANYHIYAKDIDRFLELTKLETSSSIETNWKLNGAETHAK